jgi:hypothetical protein
VAKRPTALEHEQQYVEFLRRRLESANWRAQASAEDVAATEKKYDKAKFKLKMLKTRPG